MSFIMIGLDLKKKKSQKPSFLSFFPSIISPVYIKVKKQVMVLVYFKEKIDQFNRFFFFFWEGNTMRNLLASDIIMSSFLLLEFIKERNTKQFFFFLFLYKIKIIIRPELLDSLVFFFF